MLFSQEESLEDRLVGYLLTNSASIKELHTRLISSEQSITLRAIYKAVDALIQKGVLMKVGNKVWIDQEWAVSARARLSPPVPFLSPGERVVYTFNSIEHLDAFWKTIAIQIDEYNTEAAAFYVPHNCWAYVPERKASEDAYYSQFAQNKKYAFFTIGGTSHADLEFKREYQDDFFQVDMRSIEGFSRRDHVSILGNFITTTRLSKDLSERLDSIYSSNEPISKILPQVLSALRAASEFRLVFEHNSAKARKLRKTLSSNFHLPSSAG